MNDFYVGIGINGWKTKPCNAGKEKRDTFNNYQWFDIDMIADLVGNQGYSIIPSQLSGGLQEANFKSIQIFMLDFDGQKWNEKKGRYEGKNITYEEVKVRAANYGLDIAFAYKTFSCPDTYPFYKFRIAFIHRDPIINLNAAKVTYRILLSIFPEGDPACQSLERLFYGGKHLIAFNRYAARFDLVYLLLRAYSAIDDEHGHLHRNIHSIVKNTDIAVINNRIAICNQETVSIFGENHDSNKYIYILESQFSPIFYIQDNHSSDNKKYTRIKSCEKHRIELNSSIGGCRLLQDFYEGIPLDHNPRFMIATNMQNITNGMQKFTDIIEKYYDREAIKHWSEQKPYFKGYKPMECTPACCQYYEQCTRSSNHKNIVGKLLKTKKVFINDNTEYVSLECAKQNLRTNMENALLSEQTGIHLIKAQTGLGKTTQIIELIRKYPGKKILVAEPTNGMKREIEQRIRSIIPGCRVYVTPSIAESRYIKGEIKDRWMNAHDNGFHHRVKEQIKEILQSYDKNSNTDYGMEELYRIYTGLDYEDISSCQVVITTHAMLANITENQSKIYDTIIIDEDYLYFQQYKKIYSVRKDILGFISRKDIPIYSDVAEKILKTSYGGYAYRSDWNQNYDLRKLHLAVQKLTELMDKNKLIFYQSSGNVFDIIHAGAYKSIGIQNDGREYISYLSMSELPVAKYIVLSATADEEIYRTHFRSRMNVVSYPACSVKYRGKVIQYTHETLGRSGIEKNSDIYECVNRITGNSGVQFITFKDKEENGRIQRLLNDANLHFGNGIGINALEGRNLAVIGTPYMNLISYELPCAFLYGDCAVRNVKMANRRVRYRNKDFVITTYENEDIQHFHLFCLESELEQAIGRSRLLWNDCTVYVFSSFPCEQAQIITDDYLGKYREEKQQMQALEMIQRVALPNTDNRWLVPMYYEAQKRQMYHLVEYGAKRPMYHLIQPGEKRLMYRLIDKA